MFERYRILERTETFMITEIESILLWGFLRFSLSLTLSFIHPDHDDDDDDAFDIKIQ